MPKKNKKPLCKVCKSPFERVYNTTQRVCGIKCAKVLAEQKSQEKRQKDARKKKKEFYDNDLKHQKKLTQAVINKLAVTEGKLHYLRQGRKPECISCQNQNSAAKYCGGHYKTRGGNPELALDIKNIFYQCDWNCNLNLSGNVNGHGNTRGMTAGIIAEYGQERIDYLNEPREPKKWTCKELIELRAEASKKIKENLIEIESYC